MLNTAEGRRVGGRVGLHVNAPSQQKGHPTGHFGGGGRPISRKAPGVAGISEPPPLRPGERTGSGVAGAERGWSVGGWWGGGAHGQLRDRRGNAARGRGHHGGVRPKAGRRMQGIAGTLTPLPSEANDGESLGDKISFLIHMRNLRVNFLRSTFNKDIVQVLKKITKKEKVFVQTVDLDSSAILPTFLF